MVIIGTYIDAVYHTSIVLGSREFYYGQGIQVSVPGQTHHGDPMEIVDLGVTELPDEVVLEYLESLKGIYAPEKYDLFMVGTHYCSDLSMTRIILCCEKDGDWKGGKIFRVDG